MLCVRLLTDSPRPLEGVPVCAGQWVYWIQKVVCCISVDVSLFLLFSSSCVTALISEHILISPNIARKPDKTNPLLLDLDKEVY